MARESIANIGLVCPDHAPKSGKFTGVNPSTLVGKFVKKAFEGRDPRTQETRIEHMWVKIGRVEGETLHGVLDNDPVLEMDVKDGDPVSLTISEVEAVCD